MARHQGIEPAPRVRFTRGGKMIRVLDD